jgi:hypothetical protein
LLHRGTGEIVHLEEEFRLLTLQVIGEAILSLPPEDCDRVSSSSGCSWSANLYNPAAPQQRPLLIAHNSCVFSDGLIRSALHAYRCLPVQVFPQLYLPVMEESNKRVLRPHRKYLPTLR